MGERNECAVLFVGVGRGVGIGVSGCAVEGEADHQEVDGYGDAEDAEWCKLSCHAKPEEEVEQCRLYEVVGDMCACEADAIAGGGLLAEGEMCGKPVVAAEADDIANGKGHVGIGPLLQQEVDGVVDDDSQCSHDGEAEHLTDGAPGE